MLCLTGRVATSGKEEDTANTTTLRAGCWNRLVVRDTCGTKFFGDDIIKTNKSSYRKKEKTKRGVCSLCLSVNVCVWCLLVLKLSEWCPPALISDTSRAEPVVSFHQHAIALHQGLLPHFRASHSVAFHCTYLNSQHNNWCSPLCSAPSALRLPPLCLFDQFLSICLSLELQLSLLFSLSGVWLTAVSFHIIAS